MHIFEYKYKKVYKKIYFYFFNQSIYILKNKKHLVKLKLNPGKKF